MTRAATTSPFATDELVQPWILWQKKAEVSTLQDATDPPPQGSWEREEPIEPAPAMLKQHRQLINRPQYNAVHSRMNQATRRTGSFASWKQG